MAYSSVKKLKEPFFASCGSMSLQDAITVVEWVAADSKYSFQVKLTIASPPTMDSRGQQICGWLELDRKNTQGTSSLHLGIPITALS